MLILREVTPLREIARGIPKQFADHIAAGSCCLHVLGQQPLERAGRVPARVVRKTRRAMGGDVASEKLPRHRPLGNR